MEVREGCFRLLARCACRDGGGSARGSGRMSEYQMATSSTQKVDDVQYLTSHPCRHDAPSHGPRDNIQMVTHPVIGRDYLPPTSSWWD